MLPSVTVLMSVYNGEAYVREQIDSILAQIDVDLYLYIRDDGSNDGTRAILDEYARSSTVAVAHGMNVGIRDSFLSMFETVPFDTDYYALADADDFWLPNKLAAAIALLAGLNQDKPAGYASQTTIADEHLNAIGPAAQIRRQLGLGNAMLECCTPGATCVVNRSAKIALGKFDYSGAIMHDSWVYLVISALGSVVHDPRSFILYRQHGRNADGGVHSFRKRWSARLDRRRLVLAHVKQAAWFYQQAKNELDSEACKTLRLFIEAVDSRRTFLRFVIAKRWYMQNILSEALFLLHLSRGSDNA